MCNPTDMGTHVTYWHTKKKTWESMSELKRFHTWPLARSLECQLAYGSSTWWPIQVSPSDWQPALGHFYLVNVTYYSPFWGQRGNFWVWAVVWHVWAKVCQNVPGAATGPWKDLATKCFRQGTHLNTWETASSEAFLAHRGKEDDKSMLFSSYETLLMLPL